MQNIATQHHHPEPELVVIQINRTPYDIPKGRHAVSALKDWAEIPPADELERVVHKKLEPLDDNAVLEIQGGEKFISHPRDGGSS